MVARLILAISTPSLPAATSFFQDLGYEPHPGQWDSQLPGIPSCRSVRAQVGKVAPPYDLGALNVFVALTIAVVKATVVVLYFMHVRYSSRLTQVIVAAGVLWLIIMLTFTLADYMTRGWDSGAL